jgi:hypothetical protein
MDEQLSFKDKQKTDLSKPLIFKLKKIKLHKNLIRIAENEQVGKGRNAVVKRVLIFPFCF